jgi:death-on-curing protein
MRKDPLFLSLAQIIELHGEAVKVYGGTAGTRDFGLLESAVAQAKATFGRKYLHEDLPAMAAAYCYHIVMNHPFIDGNKRVGAMAAFVFLDMNDAELVASQEQYRDMVLDLAAGKLRKDEVTAFFRKHVKS